MITERTLEILLQPGEYYFTQKPNTQIRTLLGSCVSVTLWHPEFKIGGMCHYLLPSRKKELSQLSTKKADPRYADEALWLLHREIKRLDLPLNQFQAKIFGGGRMYNFQKLTPFQDIGSKNIEAAKQLLNSMGLRFMSEHVGGMGHRNVLFNLYNGDVWVKQKPLPEKK